MTEPVREPLPHFPYFPDPVGAGSVQPADIVCSVCGKRRLFQHIGFVIAPADHATHPLCPWCVADGSAHRAWDAVFGELDQEQYGGTPPDHAAEVLARTPAYPCQNRARWPGHHGDLCVFLGALDSEEDRRNLPPAERAAIAAAVAALSAEEGPGDDLPLDPDAGPEAFLFQCRTCGEFLAYAEFSWAAGPMAAPPYDS